MVVLYRCGLAHGSQQLQDVEPVLICNPNRLTPMEVGSSGTKEDLLSLYQQFEAFGQTIGQDNVAVWFWK